MKDTETQPTKCPECGALKSHTFNCSRIPLEDAREQLKSYHAAWWKLENQDRQWRKKLEQRAENERNRLREMVTLWQGKFAIVVAENNALRRAKNEKSQQIMQNEIEKVSPWSGIALIFIFPIAIVLGAIIGAFYGAYKGGQAMIWNAYHRGCGDWEFIKPKE